MGDITTVVFPREWYTRVRIGRRTS